MTMLPSYAAMARAYPNQEDPAEVFKLIGGKVEQNRFENSCVIRVSRALNYSGQPIRRSAWALTVSGADGKWYAFRVAEFAVYMRNVYGAPPLSLSAPAGQVSRARFAGQRGIIAFEVEGWSNATGHFDLWDGARCLHADYFNRAKTVHLWTSPA